MEAQAETNLIVANKRLDLYKSLIDLDDIQAEDDYELTITTVLKDFGTPLSLAFISRVLPDGNALAAARKSLKEPNEKKNRPVIIEEYKDPKDKTRVMIKLVAQAAPVAEQQTPPMSAPAAEPQPIASEEAEVVVTAPAVTEPATAA